MGRMKIHIVFCTLLWITPSYSQDPVKLSLEQILSKVEKEYPVILEFDFRIMSLQSKVDGSKSSNTKPRQDND